MRHLTAGLLLTVPLLLNAQERVVLVVDGRTHPVMRAGLEQGARAALQAAWERAQLQVLEYAPAGRAGALKGAAGCLLFLPATKAANILRIATAAGIPALDLGQARLAGPKAPPDPYGDHAAQAEHAAWWLTGPFAHRNVAVFHGRHKGDRAMAAAFVRAFRTTAPQRVVQRPVKAPAKEKGAVKLLDKLRKQGVTALFCAASLAEALPLARAARKVAPPPVVLLSSAALAAGPAAGGEEGEPLLPQGTMVLDRDLPEKDVIESFGDATQILSMTGPGGPWALAAFDGSLALMRATRAGGKGGGSPAQLLAGGMVTGVRPRWVLGKPDPLAIGYIPLIMDGGRLHPFPPMDPDIPRERPRRIPYQVSAGKGSLPQWTPGRFRARRGTFVCQFTWGNDQERTIDKELEALKMSTGGKLPVIDHLVREKVMARLLGITGEKFGADAGGAFQAGSLLISMTMKVDRKKDKPKRVWRVLVAGDDPSAGGRAFGSWCAVYSTFIYRTIFKKYDLLEEPIGLAELPRLTGLGRDQANYVLGSREDIVYRLIDKFAGSMALTAAHEIGHLCGLGHDTKDPVSIMNVREGAGIDYPAGKFIPEHRAHLEKLLGVFKTRGR